MFGKKCAAVAAAACCLGSFIPQAAAYFPVSTQIAGGIQPRLEIHQLMLDPIQWNLFLLALQRMQQTPENYVDSYYQICGIHGQPYVAWDDNPPVQQQVTNTGYCPHGTQLFFLWHRPYVALFEQSLINNAQAVASSFNDQRYLNAANTLRMPYWDWAVNSTVPQEVSSSWAFVYDAAGNRQTINNPLYSYRFQNPGPDVRHQPNIQATWRDPNYLANLYNFGSSARQWVGLLLNTFNICWKGFASGSQEEGSCGPNTPFTYSLETIHNSVHTLTGGTMGPLQTSGFEPIFWLHHCNVDRLGAIWQAINFNTFVEPTYSSVATFAMGAGWRDANALMLPFRWGQGASDWWTATYSRYVSSFGYTYPEFQGFSGDQDPRTVANGVWERVQALYGSGRTMLALSTNNFATERRNAAPQTSANTLTCPPPVDKLKPFAKQLIGKDGEFSEYTASIKLNKAALPSTFTVNLFLGEGDGIKNKAGLYGVLKMDAPPANITSVEKTVKGAITLTDPLLNLLVKGDLKGFDTKTVKEYCQKNLKWKITSFDGKDYSSKAAAAQLEIELLHATVTPSEKPVNGLANVCHVTPPETVYSVTKA